MQHNKKNAPTTSKRKVESGKRFLSGTSDVDVPSLKFFHWSYYAEVHWNIHRNKIVKGFIENQMDSEEHSYFLKINRKRAIHCRPRVEERIISKYSLVNRRKKTTDVKIIFFFISLHGSFCTGMMMSKIRLSVKKLRLLSLLSNKQTQFSIIIFLSVYIKEGGKIWFLKLKAIVNNTLFSIHDANTTEMPTV